MSDGGDIAAWAKKRAGTPYIAVIHHGDGKATAVDFPSKKDAHAFVKTMRKAGLNAYAHDKDFAAKFGLDPRDQPRDDHGRFTSK